MITTGSPARSPTPTHAVPTGSLPIIVAQFDQGGRSELWTLIVIASETVSHMFEIRGNRDSYTYVPGVINRTLSTVPAYRGGCHVGNIPKDKVEEVKQRFKEIPIVKQDARWDPQVWVLDAIKVLKEEEWLFKNVNEAFVRKELQEDMVRWNSMEETVDERLLTEIKSDVPVKKPTTPSKDGKSTTVVTTP